MGADPLRKALAALEPTREGFEGLTAELVNAATQGRLNLMSSGEQSGLDAISAQSFSQPRRALQAKRYDVAKLSVTYLSGEMSKAVGAFPELDTWVLPTLQPVHGKEEGELREAARRSGLGLVLLDWTAEVGKLPRLGVLASAHRDVLAKWIMDKDALARADEIATSPGFAGDLKALQNEFAQADLNFENARTASCDRLSQIFSDGAAARRIAGPSPGLLVEAPPIKRPVPIEAARQWWGGAKDAAVFLGAEGAGKTWSGLAALRALAGGIDGPLPVVISSAAARDSLDGVEAVVRALVEAAERRGVRPNDPSTFWRRKLEIWAATADQTDGPRVLILADGLDEALDVDWSRWSAALFDTHWNGLFRLLLTCREDDWRRRIPNGRPPLKAAEVVGIGSFTLAERDAYLTARGVDLEHLSPTVLQAALHPRTAFHLTRLAAEIPDLKRVTREYLLLLDFENRMLVKDGPAAWTETFTSVVLSLARDVQSAALAQKVFSVSERQVVDRAVEYSLEDPKTLSRILSELVSGGWFVRDAHTASQLRFEDTLLPDAVGMALAAEIRGLDPLDADKCIGTFLEPWGADDLTERVLRSCAVTLIFDEAAPDALVRKVIDRWRARPFRSSAAQDFWRRIQVVRPEIFLELCEDAGGVPHDWLLEWGVATLWHDHPSQRNLVEQRLFSWLTRRPLPALRSIEPTGVQRAFNRDRDRQQLRVKAYEKLRQASISSVLAQEPNDRGRMTVSIGLRVAAFMPQAPLVPAIIGWALASELSGRDAGDDELAWILRTGLAEGDEGLNWLRSATRELIVSGGRLGTRAASRLLLATGDPDDAQAATASLRGQNRTAPSTLVMDASVISLSGDLDASPLRRSRFLSELDDVAVDPDAQLSEPVSTELDWAVEATEGLETSLSVRQRGFDALARWRPQKLRDLLAHAVKKEALDDHDREEIVLETYPLLTAAERDQVVSRLGALGAPMTEDRVNAVQAALIFDRPASEQIEALLTPGRPGIGIEAVRRLLSKPTEADWSALTSPIDPKDLEPVRPRVLLAIDLAMRHGPPEIKPPIDWTAAFALPEPVDFSLMVRLAVYLQDPAAGRALWERGWRPNAAPDQPTQYLGSQLLADTPERPIETLFPVFEPDVLLLVTKFRPDATVGAEREWISRLWSQLGVRERGGRSFGGEFFYYQGRGLTLEGMAERHFDELISIIRSAWIDPATRRNFVYDMGNGLVWQILPALAGYDPKLVGEIWRGTIDANGLGRSSDVETLPARAQGVPQLDPFRREMLRRADDDETLFDAVLALQRRGHTALIISAIDEALQSNVPIERAFGLTVAGFLGPSKEADALWTRLDADPPAAGWLRDVF